MLDSGRQLPVAESPAGAVRLNLVSFAALAVSQQGDRVAGVIANLSDRLIRDVQLRVVFSRLWADEHRQGTDDPSFVATEIIHATRSPRADR